MCRIIWLPLGGDCIRYKYIASICLAFRAFYELIEWWVALASGEDAEAFLGTRGYILDTQSDMGLTLLGAISGLFLLLVLYDKQLDETVNDVFQDN